MSGAPDVDGELPFLAHLIELRERLLRAVVAVGVLFLAGIPFANRIYALLAQPLLAKIRAGSRM